VERKKEKGPEMLKTMIEGRSINFMGALLLLIEGGATEIPFGGIIELWAEPWCCHRADVSLPSFFF